MDFRVTYSTRCARSTQLYDCIMPIMQLHKLNGAHGGAFGSNTRTQKHSSEQRTASKSLDLSSACAMHMLGIIPRFAGRLEKHFVPRRWSGGQSHTTGTQHFTHSGRIAGDVKFFVIKSGPSATKGLTLIVRSVLCVLVVFVSSGHTSSTNANARRNAT